MNLQTALLESQFNGLSDADTLAALVATGTPLLNTILQTYKAMAYAPGVGVESTALVLGTLQQIGATNPLVNACYLNICSTGQDFADPIFQSFIDTIGTAGSWGSPLIAALKAMGIQPQAVWQNLGLSVAPILSDVTAARTANTNSQAVNLFCSNVWNPAVSAGQSPTQLKALVASWSP